MELREAILTKVDKMSQADLKWLLGILEQNEAQMDNRWKNQRNTSAQNYELGMQYKDKILLKNLTSWKEALQIFLDLGYELIYCRILAEIAVKIYKNKDFESIFYKLHQKISGILKPNSFNLTKERRIFIIKNDGYKVKVVKFEILNVLSISFIYFFESKKYFVIKSEHIDLLDFSEILEYVDFSPEQPSVIELTEEDKMYFRVMAQRATKLQESKSIWTLSGGLPTLGKRTK
jgi:hypothetical protein